MYVENIVIGKPIVEPFTMFSLNEDDWERVGKDKTYYTEERFLPKILVDIGIYPSVSEIRRNKPELMVELNKLDFIENLKVKQKAKALVEWFNIRRGKTLKLNDDGIDCVIEALEEQIKNEWTVLTDDADSYPECFEYVLVEDDVGEKNVACCDPNLDWYISNGEDSLELIGEVIKWKKLN